MMRSWVEAVPSEMFAWVVSRPDGADQPVRTAVYCAGRGVRKPWMVQGRWFEHSADAVQAAVMHNVALLAGSTDTEGAEPTPFSEQAVKARRIRVPDELERLAYSVVRGWLHRDGLDTDSQQL